MSTSDTIYYNFKFNGIDQSQYSLSKLFNTNINIRINDVRVFPLIKKIEDYYFNIIRFRLPTNVIPIFHYTQTKALSVTLSYGGTNVQTILIPTPIVIFNPEGVFTYQQFINNMNTALQTAFTIIQPSLPVTVTEAPYLLYNTGRETFELVVQKTYGSEDVGVWVNSKVFPYFNGFYYTEKGEPGLEINGKYARFKIYDNKNNSFDATHYILRSEFVDFRYWMDSIFFALTSPGNLPVASESIGTNLSEGKAISENIITDFIPNIIRASDVRGVLQFNPTADEYRLSDSIGKGELRALDMGVSYYDKDDGGNSGNLLHGIILLNGETFTCKMMIRNKNLGI